MVMKSSLLAVIIGVVCSLVPGMHIDNLLPFIGHNTAFLMCMAGAFSVGIVCAAELIGVPNGIGGLLLATEQRRLGYNILIGFLVGAACTMMWMWNQTLFFHLGLLLKTYAPLVLITTLAVILLSHLNQVIEVVIVLVVAGTITIFSLSTLKQPFFPMFAGFFSPLFMSKVRESGGDDGSVVAAILSSIIGALCGVVGALSPALSIPSIGLCSALFLFDLNSSEYAAMLAAFLSSQHLLSILTKGLFGLSHNAVVNWCHDVGGGWFFVLGGIAAFFIFKMIELLGTHEWMVKDPTRWTVLLYVLCLTWYWDGVLGVGVLGASMMAAAISNELGVGQQVLNGGLLIFSLYSTLL